MVKTASTMLPLGTHAPSFSLPSTDGETVTLADVRGQHGLLVAFICNHCPFVKHIAGKFAELSQKWTEQGVGVVAISSNDAANYPQDSFVEMKKEKILRGYHFPYLYDADQSVAQAYKAACTPDFFLFDAELRLVYRGQFDASRPNSSIPLTGADLDAAVEAVIHHNAVPEKQIPSIGCNIKWLPGKEPTYFDPHGVK